MFGTIGALTTIAAIAVGNALTRPPSKAEGWSTWSRPISTLLGCEVSIASSDGPDWLAVVKASTEADGLIMPDTSISQVDYIRAELLSYGTLEDGWGGDNSVAPAQSHIQAAIELFQSLPAGVPLPRPMISDDGEIGLYWNNEQWLADAVIEDEGHFSLFVRSRFARGQEFYRDSVLIEDTARIIGSAFAAS